MATKKTTVKQTEVKQELKSFAGVVTSYSTVKDSTDRIVHFSTLNKDKTRTVTFNALLTDSERYLASYIKSGAVVEVVVKELPSTEEGKRRFEIVSMMSEKERIAYNNLLAYAQRQEC